MGSAPTHRFRWQRKGGVMAEQKLHYENMGGLLIRRDGFLHWRCPDCKADGESKNVLRVCSQCKQPDKKDPS